MTIEGDIAAMTTAIRVCVEQRNRLIETLGDQARLDLPWDAALDLSRRTRNCLEREGLVTLRDLTSRSTGDLLDIRNFGARSLDEVTHALRRIGLWLRVEPEETWRP